MSTRIRMCFSGIRTFISAHRWQFVFALISSIFFTYGNLLEHGHGLHDINFTTFLSLIFNFLILFLLSLLIFKILDQQTIFSSPLIRKTHSKNTPITNPLKSTTEPPDKPSSHNKPSPKFPKKQFFLFWAIIFICWFPFFLAFYPGIWAYDVSSQFRHIDTHHPIIHTLFLHGLTALGRAIHSENFGIAITTLLQMFFFSGVLAYISTRLRSFIRSRFAFFLLFVFLALAPMTPILAISATKDIFFTGFFLLSLIFLYDLLTLPPNTKLPIRHFLPLIFSFTFFMLFRNNGVYVIILLTIILLIFTAKYLKRIFLFISLASLTLFGAIYGTLYFATHASPAALQYEAYTIPLQVITGNIIRHPEIVPATGTHADFLGLDRDTLPTDFSGMFHPFVGDFAKNSWSRLYPDKLSVLINWVKLSLKYPADSLDIHSRLTLSAWHIPSDDYAHIYNNWARGYLETAFNELDELPTSHSASRFPALQSAVNDFLLEGGWQKNPFTFLLMSPALYVWAIILLLFYLLSRRAYRFLPLLAFPFLLFLTILLGPLIIIRYLYPIILSAPVIFILTLSWIKTRTHSTIIQA